MPRVKGKGSILKAHFVGKGGSKKNFPDLSITKDLMLLSIKDNEYCEGEYLEKALQYALKNHKFTTLLIADEVYWHNLKPLLAAEPLSQEQINALKTEALKLGSEYFERNLRHFLAPLGISAKQFNKQYGSKSSAEKIVLINQMARAAGLPFEIMGWQEWVNNAPQNFKQNQAEIIALYRDVDKLKASIEKTATEFAKRHEKDGGRALWFHRAVGYLTEESPAVMWVAAAAGYNFVVYPGDMLDTFQATKDYFVVPATRGEAERSPFAILAENPGLLVNWMQTYFKREEPKPKMLPAETVQNAYSSKFFAPKPSLSKADLGTAISGAMLKNMNLGDSTENLGQIIQDLGKVFFALNSKQRNELLHVIASLSTVIDLVQDYQAQPSSSIVAIEPLSEVTQLEEPTEVNHETRAMI